TRRPSTTSAPTGSSTSWSPRCSAARPAPERRAEPPMHAGVLVPEEIARIERLALGANRRVPGSASGPHRSRSRGRSLDVVEWRDYQPGDDPRTIDVQAWARLDQVLVRLYEADVDLRVQLVVD